MAKVEKVELFRFAIVQDGVVVNIIDAPAGFVPPFGELVEIGKYDDRDALTNSRGDVPHIGWKYEDKGFLNPHVVEKQTIAKLANHLALYRYGMEISGTRVADRRIGTDRTTQSVLSSIHSLAVTNPSEMISYKTGDGFIRKPAKEFRPEIDGVRAHVQKCFMAEHVVIEKIHSKEVTTFAEVEEEYTKAFEEQTEPTGDTSGF